MSDVRVTITSVKRGDKLSWNGVDITVTRAAGDGSWADIACVCGESSWTKRQRLPMPEGTVRTS